ncbi:MAG TPA: PQQ-binding-like beta-propeller repeat protein [Ktedonobacteraceae bacterium]|nr:PQQ-binding-like beta-propeller repeat protein [Ktedonobacteraceae bacterium]
MRNHYPAHSITYRTIWVAFLVLLVALAACSDSTSSSDSQSSGSTSQTPISLSPFPTPNSSNTKAPTATAPVSSADWTMYHRDLARTGYDANEPDPASLAQEWNSSLDGAVYAEPLVVGGHVIVASEGDTLYSLDAHTGQVLWHTNVGTPVPLSSLPCGNIDPLGITGTPVYDPATNLVFAVAEVSGPAHILVGVDAGTGQVRVRRTVDAPGMDPRAHQQRAALALSHGMVYIAYGGLYGDCSDYHGWVVASQTNGQGALLSYQVPTAREGGIWATPGPAIDAAGNLYVSVGNGSATGGSWDRSDSVLKLSPTLKLLDDFAPTQWAQDNAGDADLGSMGPVLLSDGLVFAAGKSGLAYLLHANALGGIGGQIQVASICTAFGGAATYGSVAFIPCTDGLREVGVGTGPSILVGWHAPGQINGSPVIGGHTVYSLDPSGTLYALNISNGTVNTSISVPQTSRFATPTLSAGYLYVGTMTGIVAIAIKE